MALHGVEAATGPTLTDMPQLTETPLDGDQEPSCSLRKVMLSPIMNNDTRPPVGPDGIDRMMMFENQSNLTYRNISIIVNSYDYFRTEALYWAPGIQGDLGGLHDAFLELMRRDELKFHSNIWKNLIAYTLHTCVPLFCLLYTSPSPRD